MNDSVNVSLQLCVYNHWLICLCWLYQDKVSSVTDVTDGALCVCVCVFALVDCVKDIQLQKTNRSKVISDDIS